MHFPHWLRQPLHPRSTVPGWVILILLALSLLNFTRFWGYSIDHRSLIDFLPLYVGQEVLLEGESPYTYQAVSARWTEQLHSHDLPEGLLLRLVYPPWALPLFFPFTLLPMGAAFLLWFGLQPLFLLLAVVSYSYFDLKRFSTLMVVELLLLALAFKGTLQAMTVGQPVFLCLALSFLSLGLARQNRDVAAGFALAGAAFKINLVAPFLVFFLLRRRWKVLGWALVLGAFLALIPVFLTQDPTAVYQGWIRQASGIDDFAYRPTGSAGGLKHLTYHLTSMTELGALVHFFWPGIHRVTLILYTALALAVFAFHRFLPRKRTLGDRYLLSLLILLSLLTTYHFYYDCLALLPLYGWARRTASSFRAGLLLILAPLFLPVNGLLNRLGSPSELEWLYLLVPASLSATLLLLLLAAYRHPDLTRI